MKKLLLTLALSTLCLLHFGQRITVYKQCANDLSYAELGLKADVKSIEMEGAKLIEDRCTSDIISIDPFLPRVEIRGLSSHTKRDTSLVLRVRSSPAPQFDLMFQGKPVSEDNMPSPGDDMSLELIVDPAFAAQYPDDSKFIFEGVEVWMNVALGVPSKVGSSNTSGTSFTTVVSENLKDGHFTISQVTRTNYRGERIKVNMSKKDLTFSFRNGLPIR